jgi:hypothetical protein
MALLQRPLLPELTKEEEYDMHTPLFDSLLSVFVCFILKNKNVCACELLL